MITADTSFYPTPANMAKQDPGANLDPWAKAAQMARTMQSLKLLGAGQPYGQTNTGVDNV
jgi:hypothetical protein